MKIKTFFNLSLALMSLLNGYAFSFFRGFSFAMMITTFFAVIGFMCSVTSLNQFKFHFFSFVIYAILHTLFFVSVNVYSDYSKILYTAFKLIVWALFVTFAKSFFDYFLLVKYMKKIIVVTFIYLVLQYILHYVFHISLPCSFDLGIIKSNYDNYEYTIQASNSVFRPGSLWLEPSWLGYYYNAFLAILLFDKENGVLLFPKNKGKYITVVCIGILMSSSTGAIGVMLILILFNFIFKDKNNFLISLFLIVIIGIFIYFFFKFNWIENFKGISPSLDNSIYKIQNLGNNARIGRSFEMLDLLSGANKIFGVGIGNELYLTNGEYMNGIVTVVFWLGYFGLAVWLLLFLGIYNVVCRTRLQKIILFIFYFNGIFASIYFGSSSFYYVLIALYGNHIDERNSYHLR